MQKFFATGGRVDGHAAQVGARPSSRTLPGSERCLLLLAYWVYRCEERFVFTLLPLLQKRLRKFPINKRNLTEMATNLRSLQQQMLGPGTNIFEAIKQSKNQITALMREHAQLQSDVFDDIFKRLEENFTRETDSLKRQLDSLTKQNEALHEHVLGKNDYMLAMERQTKEMLAAFHASRSPPKVDTFTQTDE